MNNDFIITGASIFVIFVLIVIMILRSKQDKKRYKIFSIKSESTNVNEFMNMLKYRIKFNQKDCKLVYVQINNISSLVKAFGDLQYERIMEELNSRLSQVFGENAIICKIQEDTIAVLVTEGTQIDDFTNICNSAANFCSQTIYLANGITANLEFNIAGTEMEYVQNFENLILNIHIALNKSVEKGENQAFVYRPEIKISSAIEKKLDKRYQKCLDDKTMFYIYEPIQLAESNAFAGFQVAYRFKPIEVPEEDKVQEQEAEKESETVEDVKEKTDETAGEQETKSEQGQEQTEQNSDVETKEESQNIEENTAEELKQENQKNAKESKKQLKNAKKTQKTQILEEQIKLFQHESYDEQIFRCIEEIPNIYKKYTLQLFTVALKKLKQLEKKTNDNCKLIVHLYSKQLFLQGIVKSLKGVASSMGVKTNRIILELDEDDIYMQSPIQEGVIDEFRSNGFLIQISDFEIDDLQSMLNLKDKVDVVKISSDVLDRAQNEATMKSLLKIFVNFCKEQKIEVMGSFVKTPEQAETAKTFELNYIQGLFVSDYIIGDAIDDFVKK